MKNFKHYPMAVKHSDINKRAEIAKKVFSITFQVLLFIGMVSFLGTVLTVALVHPKYL